MLPRCMNALLFLALVLATLITVVPAEPALVRRAPQAQNPPAPTENPAPSTQPQTQQSVQPSPAQQQTQAGAQPTPNAPANNGSQPAGNATAGQSQGSGNPFAGLPTYASLAYTVQPGRASFISPTSSKSVQPLYRVDPKENVTFVWKFESLQVRPANLTLAAVGPQKATYTIAALDGLATSYVWHLNTVVPQTPLMNGLYQIQLYDQRGPTPTPQPGWLMPASGLTIAFYTPESYRPLSDSDYCPTCFYSAGQTLRDSFGPLGIAFGIACMTSVMFIYSLLY